MTILEKTRKILWGRSGNRCSICRRELVIDATKADDASVVGEECHIVSPKSQGPRHDPDFPRDELDAPDNLILLCRIHHKMIDDQCETYPVEKLSKIKQAHESWVASRLSDKKCSSPPKIKRIKENIPQHLLRLKSGRDIIDLISDAYGYSFDHDDLRSEDEVGLISTFLQEVQDWGEFFSELESGDRVKAVYRISELCNELEQAGFWVFGGREMQVLEVEMNSPSPFPVGILRVLRNTNPEIKSEEKQS